MAIALAIIGVAFAAFCVWLVVRIVNRRERWAKWTLAAVVGVPVLYVASFGPMRTVGVHYAVLPPTAPRGGFAFSIEGPNVFDEVPSAWYRTLYRPLIWVTWQSWGTPLYRYASLFPIREE